LTWRFAWLSIRTRLRAKRDFFDDVVIVTEDGMTRTIIALALGAALTLPAAARAQADFSGTWVLDTGRSQGLPEGLEQTMTVKQSGDRIELEIHLRGPQGEQRTPDAYVLDGKETDFRPAIVGGGSGTGRRTSRWLDGKRGFEARERATLEGPDGEVAVTVARKWTLAPDGNTLTIEMTMSGPQGEQASTRVYTRKS
jgi:hypothetical protein